VNEKKQKLVKQNELIDRVPHGTNQLRMRLSNERLVLSIIRRYPGISKSDIAKMTGLTPQAATIIINRLEFDGLLRRQEISRGRVGQPAVPYKLNPEGVFSVGLSIGRWSCETVLIDFVAGIRERVFSETFVYPIPKQVVDFVVDSYSRLTEKLGSEQRNMVCGYGITAPFISSMSSEISQLPARVVKLWENFDLVAEITNQLRSSVYICNDAIAACQADLMLEGSGRPFDFLYIHIGVCVGGGLVLDNRVFHGGSGRAGAVASFPMPDNTLLPGPDMSSLAQVASLLSLDRKIRQAGVISTYQCGSEGWWADVCDASMNEWINEIVPCLACVAASAVALCDIAAFVVDGDCSFDVRDRIAKEVARCLKKYYVHGVESLSVIAGSLGTDACVLGAAVLPLLNFEYASASSYKNLC